jgi:hypothetical protein
MEHVTSDFSVNLGEGRPQPPAKYNPAHSMKLKREPETVPENLRKSGLSNQPPDPSPIKLSMG